MAKKHGKKLELGLYGPFLCRWSDGDEIAITGAKARALLTMLALSADGMHSRRWLQEHLWNRAGEEHGRASLRRTLSDLRKTLGPDFERLFVVNNVDIGLRMQNVSLIRLPSDGALLEGLRINEPKFQEWLGRRAAAAVPTLADLTRSTQHHIAPSIAILPFSPVSKAPEESHFGDLVAQEVGRALSRSRLVEVISHLSSRQFAGKFVDAGKVAEALRANYAVHGTVFLDNDSFRLDADFIELKSGRLLWTRQFSGQLRDVLHGQSDMVGRVAHDCGQEILRASIELAQTMPLPDVSSHALFMASVAGIHQQYRPSFVRAREQLEELITRLPKHSVLHAWLAKWHIIAVSQGWSSDPGAYSARALDCTARALDANPACPVSLTIDGMIRGDQQSDLSTSAKRFEQAIQQDPNQALAWLMSSRMFSYLGNGKMAVEQAGKARRLSPLDPHGYFFDIMAAMAHLVNDNPAEAIRLTEQSIAANPRHTSSFRLLAVAQESAGDHVKAAATVARVMRMEPNLTVRGYLASHPAGKLPMGRKMADLLREAGVPY